MTMEQLKIALKMIVQLNNTAITLLVDAKDITGAGRLFKEALTRFRTVHAECEHGQDLLTVFSSSTTLLEAYKLDESLCQGSLAMSPGNILPISPYVFGFSSSDPRLLLEHDSLTLAAFLHNISVAEYFLGVFSATHRTRLSIAVQLNTWALDILHQLDPHQCDEGGLQHEDVFNRGKCILQMSVWLNHGHLACQFQQHERVIMEHHGRMMTHLMQHSQYLSQVETFFFFAHLFQLSQFGLSRFAPAA
mmetsp:Transcript_12831/g.24376  ORF Transcript_12831/g.24376 Transcript_12831/m.24376 type:complete len:248 (-) Transcript_12831:155-898(-)